MNPNFTVSFMAAQQKQLQTERIAARAWMAEQAAQSNVQLRSRVSSTLRRAATLILERSKQIVRETTGMEMPSGA